MRTFFWRTCVLVCETDNKQTVKSSKLHAAVWNELKFVSDVGSFIVRSFKACYQLIKKLWHLNLELLEQHFFLSRLECVSWLCLDRNNFISLVNNITFFNFTKLFRLLIVVLRKKITRKYNHWLHKNIPITNQKQL